MKWLLLFLNVLINQTYDRAGERAGDALVDVLNGCLISSEVVLVSGVFAGITIGLTKLPELWNTFRSNYGHRSVAPDSFGINITFTFDKTPSLSSSFTSPKYTIDQGCEKCPEGRCDRDSDGTCVVYNTGYHCKLGNVGTQCEYGRDCFRWAGEQFFKWKAGSASLESDQCYGSGPGRSTTSTAGPISTTTSSASAVSCGPIRSAFNNGRHTNPEWYNNFETITGAELADATIEDFIVWFYCTPTQRRNCPGLTLPQGRVCNPDLKDTTNRVWCGNVHREVDEDSLRELFKETGEPTDVYIIAGDGYRPQIAFVSFETNEIATQVVENLQGSSLMGSNIRLDWAEPRKDGGGRGTKRKQELSEKPDGCVTCFVGRLSDSVDDDKLQELFKEAGEITGIRYMERDGEFKGLAFVAKDQRQELYFLGGALLGLLYYISFETGFLRLETIFGNALVCYICWFFPKVLVLVAIYKYATSAN